MAKNRNNQNKKQNSYDDKTRYQGKNEQNQTNKNEQSKSEQNYR